MTRDEIESRVEELEAESKYAEDSPGKLYLKTLKDAHDQCEDHPGAGEAYIRRWRAHRRQMAARDRRRAAEFDVTDESESATDGEGDGDP